MRKIQFRLKRFAKLTISLGVFCFFCLRDTVRRLRGKPLPPQCVILYYHGIPPQQRKQFARQMDALVRWARPISAGRIAPLSIGQRYVAVTFDDAFESVLQNALPELEKRTIPATIFVIAGLLGQTPGWEGYPGRTMTLEELRKLPADLVTIGSHTMTHRSLLTLCEQEAMAELFESRVKLEELLRRKIRLFSFPFGAFQEEMVEWCRKAGYDRVFTTMPNAALTNPAEFVSGRVLVEPTDWPLEFYLKLLGSYRWLPWAYSAKQRFFPSRFNHEGVRDRTILNRDSDSIGNKTAVVQ